MTAASAVVATDHFKALLCLILISITPACTQRVAEPQDRTDDGIRSILEPTRGWELIGEGFQLTADSAVDSAGNVYFTDARTNRILKIDADAKLTVWKENSGGAHGVAMGPDGRLYAGQHNRKRIVAYSSDGRESVLAEDVQTHHLTVTERSELYFSDAPNHKVWFLDASGRRAVVTSEVDWPHGVRLSADRSLLIVTDSQNGNVWSFRIQTDGSLTSGGPFCRIETRGEPSKISPGEVTFDTEGSAYVATTLGVQVCDAKGNVAGIIRTPGNDGVSDVFFAGHNLHWLYVTDGERMFRRYVNRHGVIAGGAAPNVR